MRIETVTGSIIPPAVELIETWERAASGREPGERAPSVRVNWQGVCVLLLCGLSAASVVAVIWRAL